MPDQYTPALPAVDVAVPFTFSPGTAEEPGMKLWLHGTQLDVPGRIMEACRRSPHWQGAPVDLQARTVLLYLFDECLAAGISSVGVPPVGQLKDNE